MSEIDLTEDDVREEHLAEVNEPAHWLYLFGVLGLGLAVMVFIIALLDASGGQTWIQDPGRRHRDAPAAIVAVHGTRLRTPERSTAAGRERLDACL